jgi:methionyl-tRNA formyltransferase
MGTPDFAVESLRILVENDYNVVGVITMPDKHAGRGQKLQYSPVKQYALEKSLYLMQPENLKDPGFLDELRALNADLQIVVAFRMLPEVVWNMPRLGTFNLHASLLPQYRGAAPINWAIIKGKHKKTGITTFFLNHQIDTGEIILQEAEPIKEEDTAGDLHDRLMCKGATLVKKTVDLIISQKYTLQQQKALKCSYPAPKIHKEDCRIIWNRTTNTVYNFIRGLAPYPAAWTILKTDAGEALILKIFETEKEQKAHTLPCGSIQKESSNQVKVAVKDGFIRLKSIQLAGKKRMSVEEFLRGNKLTEAYRLE